MNLEEFTVCTSTIGGNRFIHPCKCYKNNQNLNTNSYDYVHESCFLSEINNTNKIKCNVCHQIYNVKRKFKPYKIVIIN